MAKHPHLLNECIRWYETIVNYSEDLFSNIYLHINQFTINIC